MKFYGRLIACKRYFKTLDKTNMSTSTIRLLFLFILLAFTSPALSGSLKFSTQTQWQTWNFPVGVLDLEQDGTVRMKKFRRNINAALDAKDFVSINAKGQEIQGGIRYVGSNKIQAKNIIDGKLNTWWQPSQNADLEDWKLEIDLGRMVQVNKIRLIFPATEDAQPFREFTVYASEGSRQIIGKDIFKYNLVGGTTLPNQETVVEYDLQTIEAGSASGDHLRTVISDTLGYRPVQYIRFIPGKKNTKAALAEIEVDALGDNIALDTFNRGGNVRTAHNLQNIASIADGSASKWWSVQALPIDWRESGVWIEWDLGATFWLNQLNMLEPFLNFGTTGFQNSNMIWFEWLTSDGSPVPTQGDETIQSPFDFQHLTQVDNNLDSGAGRNLHYDFRFPPRKVKYLFWHHESPSYQYRFVFHLFEVFLYSDGYPAEVILQSPFIDLNGTKSLRAIHWDALLPPGAQVNIRSRTGDTFEETIFYYRKSGEEIPEKLWNKLPKSQKLPIVRIPKAGSDWSSWSPIYKISGGKFTSPSPRNFVQLEVRLINDSPAITPVLRSLTLDFDDPLISGGIVASISPQEARLDSLINFSLHINNTSISRDRGFDRVILTLPQALAAPPKVLVNNGPIEPLNIENQDSTLIIDLPQRVTRNPVELILPIRMTADAAFFEGWVSNQATPDILQGIRPEEASALTVFVPEIAISSSLLRKMTLNRQTITPNGDGINDTVELEVLIVKTKQLPQVQIFDLSGTSVAILQPSTSTTYLWDGRDTFGNLLAPGIYIFDVQIAADARSDRQQQLVHLVY